MMKYTIYKTTNLINGKFYIGQHITEDENDSYIGSGTYLSNAVNKYGKENFGKDILFIFDNFDDMNNKEIEIVDEEFISKDDNYNLSLGGHNPRDNVKTTKNRFNAIDKDGNIINIRNDDPRFLSRELVGNNTGKVSVRDINGITYLVNVNDSRYVSGELISTTVGQTHSKDICIEISKRNSNMVSCKDKNTNEEFYISKKDFDSDDDLVGIAHGIKMSESWCKNNSTNNIGKNNCMFRGYWLYNSLREESANALAAKLDTGSSGIKNWCKNNKVINNKSYSKSFFLQSLGTREDIVGKTTYDLGFGFESI